MERRIIRFVLVLAISSFASVAPALAKSPGSQATDPNANSPAGVIYSIPLDSARQDAAPHGHHGQTTGTSRGSSGSGGPGSSGSTGSGGSSGGSGSGSATHGGGSAARGSSHGRAGSASGSAHHQALLIPGGQPGSLLHSANGFGSSSSVPGLNVRASSGLGAVQGNGSSAPLVAIALALVVMAIGGTAGVRAWRTPRAP